MTVFGQEGNVWISSSTMIMYTEDGGESFQTVKTLPTVDSIGFGKGKKDNSYPVVYAEGDDGENGYGIYKSEDKGKTWLRINDDPAQVRQSETPKVHHRGTAMSTAEFISAPMDVAL